MSAERIETHAPADRALIHPYGTRQVHAAWPDRGHPLVGFQRTRGTTICGQAISSLDDELDPGQYVPFRWDRWGRCRKGCFGAA